ncbi:MAG: aldehyde dehydrogenase family protein [Bacteroidia bacterium]|nr:aldehyde dehydrogenase family protein [Bacteroidia bacterium]
MKLVNPSTEAILKEVIEDTTSGIEAKFKLLKSFQPNWKGTPIQERISIIQKFYDLLELEKESLANDLSSEVGKPVWQSLNEVNGAKARIKFFIENSEKYLAEEWITPEGGTREKIVYEPLGVIANISAWNYPYLVGVNVFIPALIAGNTVMYKPSEFSTLTGLNIARLFKKAGLPDSAFQIAIGAKEVGETLLNLPFNGYFFTGSYRTGKYIYERVAPKMVPCQLELGGKDPLYVADDISNLNNTVEAVLEGVVYNTGQSCCAVERVYVHEKIYDDFVSEFKKQASALKVGGPEDGKMDVGPLTRKDQVDFLEFQVKDALDKGANILVGGNRINRKGYFFEPTVLTEVNHQMSVMMEESFGPIIGIQKVKDDSEAIALMEDTNYGLTSAVYSSSAERAQAIMEKMNSGTVYWNCCDRVSAGLPWSGRKNSGIGATLSHIGIRAFTHPKAYHLRG